MTAPSSALRDPGTLPGPLAALVRRAHAGSRDDGEHIALGIEGGGLAVAMACGIALGLERLGLTRWLDVVYGTSSGSLMAAYVAAGQTDRARALLESVCTREFVSFARVGRAPVVSLDHLMGRVRADPPVVGRSGDPEVRVLAVRVADGALCTFGPLSELEDAFAAVRASMAIPVWSGPAVRYRGEVYSDGGLIESIPVATPLAEGATQVIALRSRDAAYRKGRSGRFYRSAEGVITRRLPGELRRLVAERPARYDNEAGNLAAATAGSGPLAGRAVQLAPPVGTPLVGRLDVDRGRVRAAVEAGERVALDALTARPA
jgi:predicted patatin/cPLA2 family phospholipase